MVNMTIVRESLPQPGCHVFKLTCPIGIVIRDVIHGGWVLVLRFYFAQGVPAVSVLVCAFMNASLIGLKCSYDYTDNCRNDPESLNFGDFVFQENNSQ